MARKPASSSPPEPKGNHLGTSMMRRLFHEIRVQKSAAPDCAGGNARVCPKPKPTQAFGAYGYGVAFEIIP